MKAMRVVFPITLFFLSTASRTIAAAQKSKKSKNVFFTGTEILGEIKNHGSTKNGQDFVSIRGMVQVAQDTTNDARVTGDLIIEANAYLDPTTSQGALWGTFILENAGGKWFGAWIGRKAAKRDTIHAMGYGVEAYKGLLANWTYTREAHDPPIPFNIQGFIVKMNQTGLSPSAT